MIEARGGLYLQDAIKRTLDSSPPPHSISRVSQEMCKPLLLRMATVNGLVLAMPHTLAVAWLAGDRPSHSADAVNEKDVDVTSSGTGLWMDAVCAVSSFMDYLQPDVGIAA